MISSITEQSEFEDGLYGQVSGSDFDYGTMTLNAGTALLGSDGELTASVDELQATVFDGGMYLMKDDNSVIVAAMTSPVFLAIGDQRMIVPVGMQWTLPTEGLAPLTAGFDEWIHARMVAPLPSHFLAENIAILTKAQESSVSVLPKARKFLPIEPIAIDPLLLPTSLEELKSERRDHILGVVRRVIEENDTVHFEELVSDKEVEAAILSTRGREVLAHLLSQTDLDTPMQMEILVRIADTEHLWAITSFHPEYRDISWSLIGPDVSVESQLSRIFLFPFSLFSPEVVSDFIVDRYRMTLQGIVSQVGDSASLVENLLKAHITLVDRLEAKGYPARSQNLSDTLMALVQSMDESTKQMQEQLKYLSLSSEIDISPLPAKKIRKAIVEKEVAEEEEPEPESVPEVVYTALEVEVVAHEMLQDAGALFTVQTGIAAYAENKARVSGIFFSSPTEDRSATFTLDVYTKIVSEIEINGQTDFPYEPSFDGFVEWISK